jgi:hypothetical protein
VYWYNSVFQIITFYLLTYLLIYLVPTPRSRVSLQPSSPNYVALIAVPWGVNWPILVEIEKYLILLPVQNVKTSPKVGGTLQAYCEGPMRPTDFRFSFPEATPRVLKKVGAGRPRGMHT